MIGFSIMMWFVSIILLLESISLLRGNYSSMHGKVFNNTNDKEGYAKASGKPVLLWEFGLQIFKEDFHKIQSAWQIISKKFGMKCQLSTV